MSMFVVKSIVIQSNGLDYGSINCLHAKHAHFKFIILQHILSQLSFNMLKYF